MSKMHERPCHCGAYSFPHRYMGGKCTGDPTCKGCGEPCNIVEVDFGIGAYEYWGAPGVDKQIAEVSDCCETDAYVYSDDISVVERQRLNARWRSLLPGVEVDRNSNP